MIKNILEELDRNGKMIRDDISDGIKILLRNKSYMKNVKEFHGVLYFEMKDVKSAIRVKNRIIDYILDGSGRVSEVGASVVLGSVAPTVTAILNNKDAVAYIHIDFKGHVPNHIMKLAKVKKVSEEEYQYIYKQQNK